jgi:hypothetical protein
MIVLDVDRPKYVVDQKKGPLPNINETHKSAEKLDDVKIIMQTTDIVLR